MGNIIDYINEYQNLTFGEHPFNDVDALVLSQFAYFKWEHVIPGIMDNCEPISLTQMKDRMYEAEVFYNASSAEDNRAMWDAMLNSRRYRTLKCNYISTMLCEKTQTQFCAFTVYPDDTVPIVIFRGTDETILGWQEDYNMTGENPITGQRLAALYLKQVALRIPGEFSVAGHSKGGNLAIYSVMAGSRELQDRIRNIYCFDGPHFRQVVLDEFNYSSIEKKVRKFIPQSSVVGILFETGHNYKVVKSNATGGVAQHNPYTWSVKKGSFVPRRKVSNYSLRLNEKMIDAVEVLDIEQIELFGRILFGLLQYGNTRTTTELSRDGIKTAQNLLKAAKDLTTEEKEKCKEILVELSHLD